MSSGNPRKRKPIDSRIGISSVNYMMEERSSSFEGDCLGGGFEMEDDNEIHTEDLQKLEADSPLDMEDEDMENANTVEVDDGEALGTESLKVLVKTSYDAKLRELLRNIHSVEAKIYSEASKEFTRLLRSDSGGEMLHQYVQASPLCSELIEAWKLRQGKPGMMYVQSLLSVILDHPDGKYKSGDIGRITISRRLDKVARSIIETKLEDIYTELNSKEAKRQNAALLVVAAVVRRGVGLASEVARSFDFKLPVFPKLSEYQQKKILKKGKHSTRRSFIELSMSFLEVGNPRLLRWVLQQKDMYSGVLRGLGSDDDDTVVYVLSTLRDRVLTPESLVPPGLRSVLFGSVTLDQLIIISGNQLGGPAAEIAHKVLVMVCTDPFNGLMPDSNTNRFKGNPNRLLGVMKKLKASEITYHRELLLAIVSGMPLLGSSYMDEFPYNLEPRASPTWLAAISLAADLVSSAITGHPFGSLASQSQDPPSLDSLEVQCMLKCIVPRAFSRMVINRGLLHSDNVVKHGSLRLLLEALKSLARLLDAIDRASSNQTLQRWVSLKQEIQDEARAFLPDPQVLLKLLSSLTSIHDKASKTSLKRERKSEDLPDVYYRDKVKKLKSDMVNGDSDILISGISNDSDTALLGETGKIMGSFAVEELDHEMDCMKIIAGIWALNECSILGDELSDVDVYFHSKLLDALTLYLRTMPIAMERSFDFFKLLPGDPLSLPIVLQQSLLQLLVEHIGRPPGNEDSTILPESMYKHLQLFINLLMFSPVKGIKDQAYVLAREAMLSTGAFDRSMREIDVWFLFLPGYTRDTSLRTQEVEVFRDLAAVVVSFLCDAVSTVGNNLYKYLDHMRTLISNLKGFEDISPDFSPLVICVLQKCLRLLDSDSKTFKLSDKSMISIYVSSTLSFLLQTQVEGGLLSAVVDLLLVERFEDSVSIGGDSRKFPCEWRPLKNLFLFAQSTSCKQAWNNMCSEGLKTMDAGGGSLVETLGEVKKIIKIASGEGLVEVAIAFSASVICATSDEILECFPEVLTVSHHLPGAPLSFLLTKVFLEPQLIVDIAKLWPHMFSSGLEMVGPTRNGGCLGPNDIMNSSSAEELLCNLDYDSLESISGAFSFFLKQASFYALFPAIVTIGNSYLSDPTKKLDLLLAKLSEGSIDDSIASLRFILFWVYQIQSSHRTESSLELEQLLETCFFLINNVLQRLLAVKPDINISTASSSPIFTSYIPEVVETVFHHPVVIMSLSMPLSYTEELASGSFGDSLGDFLSFSKQRIHPMDHHILNVLRTVADYLSSCNGPNFVPEVHDTFKKWVGKAFDVLFQRLFVGFREKFDLCVSTKNLMQLVPIFYMFHALSCFISPFQLLELVQWIFSKADWDDLTEGKSFKVSALSVGIYIATCAFDMLSSCLYQPSAKVISSHWFWDVEGRNFDVAILEKIYYKVVELATSIRLDCADLCLLKAVNAVYRQKHMQPQIALLPITMELSRMVTSSPLSLLSHFIHRTSKTRAKLLFLFTEVSPLHLSHFGQIFFCILSKDLSVAGCATEMCCSSALSDEEFLMLLPIVLSYLNLSLIRFGKQHFKQFESIISFYSRILMAGFLNWKSYVSQHIFIEEYGELLPSSTEELLNLVNGSLLGKTIQMLQYYFSFNRDTMKIDSTYLHSGPHDELLDCDTNEISICTLNELLNLINKIVAKISFSRMLLFPEDYVILSLPTKADGDLKELPLGSVSKKEDRQRLRFMNILVNTWHMVVRITNNFETSKGTERLQLVKFLEAFILRSIFQLTERMQSTLIQLHSLPFLEQFTRLCLLHRFEDPATVNVLCGVLTLLSGGKFPCAVAFELLLAHSQFVPTILWSDLISDSSGLSQAGTLLRPISSILKSFFFPYNKDGADGKSEVDTSPSYQKKLVVIKLLRVLYHLKARQDSIDFGKDFGMKSRELLSLLLSCYRATLSEVDLEIFNLMNEIESVEGSDCGSIAEMDYLWGSSASKLRSEQNLEKILSTNNVIDCETVEERRRRQFRENLPIDPKLCVKTVLYFPFDRIACSGPSDAEKFRQHILMVRPEISCTSVERILRYDPVFILHFSVHALSMGYIEPMEFGALGLLGIAFVSISSPDEGMRKLGYEVLGRFKNALEASACKLVSLLQNCRNRKEGLRLQLLLTYLQNGIEEPWQKIPSLIAIFAAEASFILLDPSNEHYVTISKLLMRSPRVNLKSIPLFNTIFASSSVHFKADRLWLLRLLYAGLNLDDDAQIFKRKCIIDNLMGFYASSLSDYESRILILQIVKKSVKSQVLARYLVEHCGLILWLSSVISFSIETLHGDPKNLLVTQLTMVLEVTVGVISFRNVTEWLQKYGLEQLSELSFDLQKILAAGMKLIKQNVELVNSILQILVSTFRISQKRKIYQPHFTLSFEGLFQLFLAIDDGFSNMESGLTAELGLRAMLMSTPPIFAFHKDGEKFSKLVIWAICATRWSSSTLMFMLKDSEPQITTFSEKEQCEDSLTSKLLRWITASVILGRVSAKSCGAKTISSRISNVETLQSLLDHIKEGNGESRESSYGNDKALAAMILYLQQLLGSNCRVLPSVISALCLLLLSDAPTSTEIDLLAGNHHSLLASLCSKICCPAEAKPSWRWSFYQPWKDHSSELTDFQKLEEHHACQALLVIFSNALGVRSLDLPILSYEDVENSGLFLRERSMLNTE